MLDAGPFVKDFVRVKLIEQRMWYMSMFSAIIKAAVDSRIAKTARADSVRSLSSRMLFCAFILRLMSSFFIIQS